MPRVLHAALVYALLGLVFCAPSVILLESTRVLADVKTTAKRAAGGVKRGAQATAKAAAPVGSAVARGTHKGVTAIKHAGNAVGNAVRGK